MRLSEYACLLLNKLFPTIKVVGRVTPEAYSEAQYSWAKESLNYFTDHIDLKNKDVLDAGCGFGGKTVYYVEQGCKSVIGIDLDEKHIKYAREFAEKKGLPNIEFKTANLTNLPFESNKFDIIFLDDVVEHVQRSLLVDVFKECKRLIKPNGKICLEFPPWSSAFAAHLYDYIHIPWSHLIFSTETLSTVTGKLQRHENFGTVSYIKNFQDLNHITIKEFEKIIKEVDYKVPYYKTTMLKRIDSFRYIPFFNKYLTSRVVAILSK